VVIAAQGLALATPWYASQLLMFGWSFVGSHFGREIFDRFMLPIHGYGAPWWYPAWTLWDGGGAWVPAAVVAMAAAALCDRPRFRAMTPWAVTGMLVVGSAMITQTKLPWYSLPAVPMLAVMVGLGFGRGGAAWAGPRAVVAVGVVMATLSIPSARLTVVSGERDFEPFRALGGSIAALDSEADVIGATGEHPTLVFYGRRPLRVYDPGALEEALLDDATPPFAGIVPSDRVGTLVEAGFVEIDRIGESILLHRPRGLPMDVPNPPRPG
jgi:hypothetical protein